ncbi:hypothetical protein DDZ13_04280 [Coraliomargarita sinensis]|uniref:Uncharacterized protein n=1 Tax=Coraliomargarita sinensis TaxID=2174842 RepID=A0A317ZHJ9_9BACT|nr:hypothetical protein DDZ13_04280 [Coraliomargarita sinensis]
MGREDCNHPFGEKTSHIDTARVSHEIVSAQNIQNLFENLQLQLLAMCPLKKVEVRRADLFGYTKFD